ncbi:hypothetical protein D3C75_959490 [compost metagenome]
MENENNQRIQNNIHDHTEKHADHRCNSRPLRAHEILQGKKQYDAWRADKHNGDIVLRKAEGIRRCPQAMYDRVN